MTGGDLRGDLRGSFPGLYQWGDTCPGIGWELRHEEQCLGYRKRLWRKTVTESQGYLERTTDNTDGQARVLKAVQNRAAIWDATVKRCVGDVRPPSPAIILEALYKREEAETILALLREAYYRPTSA